MENLSKTILCLYDHSGTFSEVYKINGFHVVQVDLLFNFKDVRLLQKLNTKVYGIIAMPPCTMFSKAGSWVQRSEQDLINALSMVDCVFRFVHLYSPKFWFIENPPGKLSKYIGRPKTIIRYQDCGSDLNKQACLWGDFNFPVLEKKIGKVRVEDYSGNTEAGKVLRSATPIEFAQLFYNYNH